MNKRNNQGHTLIELVITQIVIGLMLVLAWRIGTRGVQQLQQFGTLQSLIVADQALLGFIAANHRLPCPDTLGDGLEHCSGNSIGKLPVVTLGLARADVLRVRYGVFRSAADNADLAAAIDRFYPLLAAIPISAGIAPSALDVPLGNINGIDFCQALRLAGALPMGASSISTALNIRTPNTSLANSKIIKNVAYALSLPGLGSNPLTNLNAIDNSFAAPNQPIGDGYHDTVLVADFGQIFDRMSCSSILASASHAHPNVASAAAIMSGAMLDYKLQLDLSAELAFASILSSSAGIATAGAGAGVAASNVLTAGAKAVLTDGAEAPLIIIAAVEVAAFASSIITNALTTVSASAASDIATQRVNEFSGSDSASLHLLENATAQATTVRANAIAADAAGIY